MPTYEYRCSDDATHTRDLHCSPDDALKAVYDKGQMCCPCGGVYKRRFSLTFPTMLHEHFNDTVGKPIHSHRQFRDELRRASDHATERTGIPHDYQPIDLHDPIVAPKSDAGMKETHDLKVNLGLKPPTPKLM